MKLKTIKIVLDTGLTIDAKMGHVSNCFPQYAYKM